MKYFVITILFLVLVVGVFSLARSLGVAKIQTLVSKMVSVSHTNAYVPTPYKEIVKSSGFINTHDTPVTIGEYVGKKVVLVNFMSYDCINCVRALPHVNEWYKKYKDEGFVVVGVHTPEFAFEKERGNVEKALAALGVEFPVVLDNDYATWNAYNNTMWPHEYLIDMHGDIVYEHGGEGGYEVTEVKIQELLKK